MATRPRLAVAPLSAPGGEGPAHGLGGDSRLTAPLAQSLSGSAFISCPATVEPPKWGLPAPSPVSSEGAGTSNGAAALGDGPWLRGFWDGGALEWAPGVPAPCPPPPIGWAMPRARGAGASRAKPGERLCGAAEDHRMRQRHQVSAASASADSRWTADGPRMTSVAAPGWTATEPVHGLRGQPAPADYSCGGAIGPSGSEGGLESWPTLSAPSPAAWRLNIAVREVVKYIRLEPPFLNEVVRQVVETGWRHITWRNGYTGLHAAVEVGCAELLPLLAALGADPAARSAKGRTAADVARRKGHRDCEQILLQIERARGLEDLASIARARRGGDAPPSLLRPGAFYDQALGGVHGDEGAQRLFFILAELVSLLRVEQVCAQAVLHVAATGCGGTAARGWYTTALHLVAERGEDYLVPLLVALGADPTAMDSGGLTATDVARARGQWACVEALSHLPGLAPLPQSAVPGRQAPTLAPDPGPGGAGAPTAPAPCFVD